MNILQYERLQVYVLLSAPILNSTHWFLEVIFSQASRARSRRSQLHPHSLSLPISLDHWYDFLGNVYAYPAIILARALYYSNDRDSPFHAYNPWKKWSNAGISLVDLACSWYNPISIGLIWGHLWSALSIFHIEIMAITRGRCRHWLYKGKGLTNLIEWRKLLIPPWSVYRLPVAFR